MGLVLLYVGLVVAANWACSVIGTLPTWPGLEAPAGVYLVGLVFTVRDLVHRRHGREWSLWAIGAGGLVSALFSPQFALASAGAFLLSELLDLAVFSRQEGRWLAGVAVSNVAGLVANSAVFLWLAFGSLAMVAGQIVGKGWMTAAAVAGLWLWRRR